MLFTLKHDLVYVFFFCVLHLLKKTSVPFDVFFFVPFFRRRQTEAAGCALHLFTEVQICGRLGPHDTHVEHQQWG